MNKQILCISNDKNFFFFCKIFFKDDFNLLYARYDDIDVFYEEISRISAILLSDENVSPERLKKTFERLQKDNNSVFICIKKNNTSEYSTHNIILSNEDFKKNAFSKIGAISGTTKNARMLVGNTRTLEKNINYSAKTFKEKLDIASRCNLTVLLIGETGSGKNFAAKYIHNNSDRNGKPFTEENLACINVGLMESTLFGSVRGSFTGAEDKLGLLEDAKDGTLFLDEIGELSLETQGKFLRFLDTRIFRRVGSQKEIKCNARIIFATNADLIAREKEGKFKKELFQRISVLIIKIPPLRERKDEIEHLAVQFAAPFNKKLSVEALKKLESYPWTGNIRELKNCIERSAVMTDNSILSDSDIIFLNDCF